MTQRPTKPPSSARNTTDDLGPRGVDKYGRPELVMHPGIKRGSAHPRRVVHEQDTTEPTGS